MALACYCHRFFSKINGAGFIAVASVIFVLMNVATLAIVSAIYFKEPLSSRQLLGIILGLASVVIMELEES